MVESHTCTSTCHIMCDETIPTNVRHQATVWRCQECVSKEGATNCRVSKWAKGHRQEYDETLKDKWNTRHSWVGRKVEKLFDDVQYTGKIDQWLPDSKTEWELWRIKYDDGDMEELDILELMQVIKEHTTQKQNNPQETTQPQQPQTKRELTRKDKRREKKRRRQHTNDIDDHDTA